MLTTEEVSLRSRSYTGLQIHYDFAMAWSFSDLLSAILYTAGLTLENELIIRNVIKKEPICSGKEINIIGQCVTTLSLVILYGVSNSYTTVTRDLSRKTTRSRGRSPRERCGFPR